MHIHFKQNIILTDMHSWYIFVLPQPIYNVEFNKHTKTQNKYNEVQKLLIFPMIACPVLLLKYQLQHSFKNTLEPPFTVSVPTTYLVYMLGNPALIGRGGPLTFSL